MELGEPVAADSSAELRLGLVRSASYLRHEHQPTTRRKHEPRSTVARIGLSLDVVETLELGDELGHRLLGDPRPPGEVGAPRAGPVEEQEQPQVTRPDVVVAGPDEPRLDVGLDCRERRR